MSVISSSILAGASGSAGEDKVYVDDVFSTYLWKGNATARSFNNGIDLSGEGGLVWIKNRDSSRDHVLCDTVRGAGKTLRSNDDTVEQTATQRVSAFSSNGFSVGTDTDVNNNNEDIASWTFRKAPGFFDVVTYSGTGSATGQTISHALGSTPGFIAIKELTGTSWWVCWHRSLGAARMFLNENNAAIATNIEDYFGNGTNYVAPTASSFMVNSHDLNDSGNTYVAYIFAHDDAQFGTDEDESIIKCGSYTGNGGSVGTPINLGFEPQWILTKDTTASNSWNIVDNMRGMVTTGNDQIIIPNTSAAEVDYNYVDLTATGFTPCGHNNFSHTYIYMAIRRPNKPPSAATEVFAMDTGNGSSSIPTFDSGFPVDFAIQSEPDSVASRYAAARLVGTKFLRTNDTNSENNNSHYVWDSNLGWGKAFTSTYSAWMFKRAPGFFDVVAYDGATGGASQNIQHNLGVVPEFMIVKRRSAVEDWATYHSSLGNSKDTKLNESSGSYTNANTWDNTTPTSSVFRVGGDGSVNQAGQTFIAYLFATLPGISKVGSYSGTGDQTNGQNIDCGFTNGARFILIKRTDGAGHWTLYDSARGIISGGNSPYLKLDTTEVQATGNNHLGAYAQGFNIREYNFSGQTYIFLAIA